MENVKLCKDCKWCTLPYYTDDLCGQGHRDRNAECNHPKNIIKKTETSYITGELMDFSYKIGTCKGQRGYSGDKDDRFCGVDAFWFEPKE